MIENLNNDVAVSPLIVSTSVLAALIFSHHEIVMKPVGAECGYRPKCGHLINSCAIRVLYEKKEYRVME